MELDELVREAKEVDIVSQPHRLNLEVEGQVRVLTTNAKTYSHEVPNAKRNVLSYPYITTVPYPVVCAHPGPTCE